MEYDDATINSSPNLRHESLVLRSAGEIIAAQDTLGSEESGKLAETLACQNNQLSETLELRVQERSHFRIGMPLLSVAPKTQ